MTSKRKAEPESLPSKKAKGESKLSYLSGFGNEFESEARPGALPLTNTPKKCPFGLYAELLTGTAFTAPRADNQRSWMYRTKPAAQHSPMKPYEKATLITSDFSAAEINPNRLRWRAFPLASEPTDFVEGIKTLAGAGGPETKTGLAIHVYAANRNMRDRSFCNADGDLLVVPEKGAMRVRTEFGLLEVNPGEVFVVPRGIHFSVDLLDCTDLRGYICEIFSGHFRLPELGPIGSNGLAHARDFQAPVAAYEDRDCTFEMVFKFAGKLFTATKDHSPFNTVAWRGNYHPFKYDLARYVAMNSVTVDHIDPCIFTVLTCQTTEPGVAAADFVVFPPRWCVQANTFRPPYYHRNTMTEFMGNIRGQYEAKPDGFPPGSASLHSCMMGHGPDTATFEKASEATDDPIYLSPNDLAFMFETTYILRLTKFASSATKDEKYDEVWSGLKNNFREAK